MPCVYVEARWNHPQIWGLGLLILKSMWDFMSILDLVFNKICNSLVKFDFESMLQRLLYNNNQGL
jgi:hypothetical protein